MNVDFTLDALGSSATLLMYYVDRDRDGLRDIEELILDDLRDGIYDLSGDLTNLDPEFIDFDE